MSTNIKYSDLILNYHLAKNAGGIIKSGQAPGGSAVRGLFSMVLDNAYSIIPTAAMLAISFTAGLASVTKPMGEYAGRALKKSPIHPLSKKEIANMLIQHRLLKDSERLKNQKEMQLARLTKDIIDEEFNLPK